MGAEAGWTVKVKPGQEAGGGSPSLLEATLELQPVLVQMGAQMGAPRSIFFNIPGASPTTQFDPYQ